MEETQAPSNTMENSTAESSLSSSTEQAPTRIPFSRASTAVTLSTPSPLSPSHGNHGQSSPLSDTGEMTSEPMSGAATLLTSRFPTVTAIEVGSRSSSPSSLQAVYSQRRTRPGLLRFPTWRQARSADPTSAPAIYASRQSTRSRISQTPMTMSESALFGMYPLHRPPTPMPPRQVEAPSRMTRLRRSVFLRVSHSRSFRSRSFKSWYRRRRRNSSDSTETEPDTPKLQLRSPASDVVDNLDLDAPVFAGGLNGRMNEPDTPQSNDAALDAQPIVPARPKGHYGPCTSNCMRHSPALSFPEGLPLPAEEMNEDPKPEDNPYHHPQVEDINEDPRPEDNPYHPYRIFKNKDGTFALVPIEGPLKIGEGASRAGFGCHELTVQGSGSNRESMSNGENSPPPADLLPEIPTLSRNRPFDLGRSGRLFQTSSRPSPPSGTSHFSPPPRMRLGPTTQEQQQRKHSDLEPPRPSILYPAESRSKEAQKHGRVVIPELIISICYIKLSPDWTLEFDKELSEKIRSAMLYENYGSLFKRFKHTAEEISKGELGRKIIREFDWRRRCQRPSLNPIRWTEAVREKEEVLQQIKAVKAAEEATSKELAALNNPSRGESFRRLIKRTISSARKASTHEEAEDRITSIAEEANVSREGGEAATLNARVDESSKPTPEGVDRPTPDLSLEDSVTWDAVAALQLSQAILNSMDIEFGPEGNMAIKGDAAQRLLANAVLRIRRDHPILKIPETFMTLPTSGPILKEADGNVDIILNHLSHGRWTWIMMRNGEGLDIDFEKTADMVDARMLFRHNNIITSPIVKFCEGVKDPCGDLSWHEGVAKLEDYLPKLVQRSKYYTGQLDQGPLDFRRFGKYVDLFNGEDVRLAKAVREAVEGRDGLKRTPVNLEIDEVELDADEPTKTPTGVQNLVSYLPFLAREKDDSKVENPYPKNHPPKDSWTLIEEEARDEACQKRKQANKSKPTETETVGEHSLKFIQDYANPENWNVKDPRPDIPWIIEGPIVMDESLERGDWDIYYEYQIKDAKKEKRPYRQLYHNTVLNDGGFGGEVWDFLRYVRRRHGLWVATAAEEIEWWDSVRAMARSRPKTVVGYFPSAPPFVHLSQDQQSPDNAQSMASTSDSNPSSRNSTGELQSHITTPENTAAPENNNMQSRNQEAETFPTFSSSLSFESSRHAVASQIGQVSATPNEDTSISSNSHKNETEATAHSTASFDDAPVGPASTIISIDALTVSQQAETSPASPQAVDMATVAHKLQTISNHARTDSEGSSQTNDSGYVSVMPSTPKPRNVQSSVRSGKSRLDQVIQ